VDENRAIYEARAAQQYAEPQPLPDPRIDRKFRRIRELVRAQLPCQAFLDAGCGDGRYLAALADELPGQRAGVDISERILETARRRVDADFRRANLEALPFAGEEFDVVLCSQVIEHVLDADLAVAELARVLRPGGALVISTDNAHNYVTRTLNAPRTLAVGALRLHGARGRIESPATPYTRGSFRTLLEGAGFAVELLETFRFHLMWPLGVPPLTRALNAVDAHLPRHGLGDIVVAVARR
jgi:ubiquinone/menaquinone biosynthesis C-methylase UbiE